MTTSSSSDNAPLHVSATKYMPSGAIRFDKYRSGETAIEVIGQHRERQYVATVALVPSGATHPGEYSVWLKGWSENEIVTLTGRRHPTGFCEAEHANLMERARAALLKVQGVVGAKDRSRTTSAPRNQREYLGDSVFVEEDGGMIRLTGDAFGRDNVIFLASGVYAALRRWAQTHGYEGGSHTGDGICQSPSS